MYIQPNIPTELSFDALGTCSRADVMCINAQEITREFLKELSPEITGLVVRDFGVYNWEAVRECRRDSPAMACSGRIRSFRDSNPDFNSAWDAVILETMHWKFLHPNDAGFSSSGVEVPPGFAVLVAENPEERQRKTIQSKLSNPRIWISETLVVLGINAFSEVSAEHEIYLKILLLLHQQIRSGIFVEPDIINEADQKMHHFAKRLAASALNQNDLEVELAQFVMEVSRSIQLEVKHFDPTVRSVWS